MAQAYSIFLSFYLSLNCTITSLTQSPLSLSLSRTHNLTRLQTTQEREKATLVSCPANTKPLLWQAYKRSERRKEQTTRLLIIPKGQQNEREREREREGLLADAPTIFFFLLLWTCLHFYKNFFCSNYSRQEFFCDHVHFLVVHNYLESDFLH